MKDNLRGPTLGTLATNWSPRGAKLLASVGCYLGRMARVEIKGVAVRPVNPGIDDSMGKDLWQRCLQVWRWSFPLGMVFALLQALRDFTVSQKLESGLPLSYWLIGEGAVYAFWSFFAPLILWVMLRFPLTRKA